MVGVCFLTRRPPGVAKVITPQFGGISCWVAAHTFGVVTTHHDRLGAVDFVVDNVSEKWDVKKAVYARLDSVCPPACV